MFYKLISLGLLIIVHGITKCAPVTPTFIARSQSCDAAKKLVGVTNEVHLTDAGRYINFSIMPEYTRSMQSRKIAQALFGCDLVSCNKILIQGSSVAHRDERAWLADYLYLAPDYNSYFTVTPVIQNFMLNLDLFANLDRFVDGMYVRFYGPLTYTKWNLNFSQPTCDVVTTGSYSAGYFNTQVTATNFSGDPLAVAGLNNNQLLRTVGEYFSGKHPGNLPAYRGYQFLGTEFIGLHEALIEPCSRSNIGFAELRGELGWDFCQKEYSHLGINFQIAAPTGNKRVAQFAFDSVVGNGNHWEVGGGVTGHYIFWENDIGDRRIGFYLDANITHLNTAKEQRTFDLCDKPNSRYMLAMKMGFPDSFFDVSLNATYRAPTLPTASPNPALLATSPLSIARFSDGLPSSETPQATFKGLFTPVANITTLDVNVSVNVQADIAAMIGIAVGDWNLDCGYNFYVRSHEKIQPRDTQCCLNVCSQHDMWALKGDARVMGFMSDNSTGIDPINSGNPIRLSATQSLATIHHGTNATENQTTCEGIPTLVNCGVDNPRYAYGASEVALTYAFGLPYSVENHIKTSFEPVFINCCDINFQSTSALSNKIFGHINRTWNQWGYKLYLGVGGFGEFGVNNVGCCTSSNSCSDASDCCPNKCSPTLRSTLSQWGIWIKGGIEFK